MRLQCCHHRQRRSSDSQIQIARITQKSKHQQRLPEFLQDHFRQSLLTHQWRENAPPPLFHQLAPELNSLLFWLTKQEGFTNCNLKYCVGHGYLMPQMTKYHSFHTSWRWTMIMQRDSSDHNTSYGSFANLCIEHHHQSSKAIQPKGHTWPPKDKGTMSPTTRSKIDTIFRRPPLTTCIAYTTKSFPSQITTSNNPNPRTQKQIQKPKRIWCLNDTESQSFEGESNQSKRGIGRNPKYCAIGTFQNYAMYYLYVYTHRQMNVSLLLIQSSELQWLFVITESCLINSSPHFRHSQSPHKFFPPFSKLTFTDPLCVHLSGHFFIWSIHVQLSIYSTAPTNSMTNMTHKSTSKMLPIYGRTHQSRPII